MALGRKALPGFERTGDNQALNFLGNTLVEPRRGNRFDRQGLAVCRALALRSSAAYLVLRRAIDKAAHAA